MIHGLDHLPGSTPHPSPEVMPATERPTQWCFLQLSPIHTLDCIFIGLYGGNLQELWFQMGLDSFGFPVYPECCFITQTSQGMKTGCVWFSLAFSFRFLACGTPSLVLTPRAWHPSDLGCWCVAWNQLFLCFCPLKTPWSLMSMYFYHKMRDPSKSYPSGSIKLSHLIPWAMKLSPSLPSCLLWQRMLPHKYPV